MSAATTETTIFECRAEHGCIDPGPIVKEDVPPTTVIIVLPTTTLAPAVGGEVATVQPPAEPVGGPSLPETGAEPTLAVIGTAAIAVGALLARIARR